MQFEISFKTSKAGKPMRASPVEFADVPSDRLHPVREPGSIKGQSNIPGFFWMSQLKRLVWHESRLEGWTLKKLDYEFDVCDVVPQPFILHWFDEATKKHHRHVPDFLVCLKSGGRRVVNTKLRRYCNRPDNARCFAAASALCETLSWQYATESEPGDVLRVNLNFLAGYRRLPPKFTELVDGLSARLATPTRIGALDDGSMGAPALVKPILFHLMWKRAVKFDVAADLLNSDSIVSFG